MLLLGFPKKHRLGPQNNSGSSGTEKLQKIVNCATIKETEKLKETMVGAQVDLAGGHQYPPGLDFNYIILKTHMLHQTFKRILVDYGSTPISFIRD